MINARQRIILVLFHVNEATGNMVTQEDQLWTKMLTLLGLGNLTLGTVAKPERQSFHPGRFLSLSKRHAKKCKDEFRHPYLPSLPGVISAVALPTQDILLNPLTSAYIVKYKKEIDGNGYNKKP